jgi:choline dehydrogenase-like flavoprotein
MSCNFLFRTTSLDFIWKFVDVHFDTPKNLNFRDWVADKIGHFYVNQGGFVLSKVYAPRSSGHLRLETTNVSKNPFVQFNYYNNTHDIQTCRKGIQYLNKLLNSSAMSSFKFDTVTPLVLELYPNLGIPVGHKFVGAQIPTDMKNVSATTQWCKDTVTTIWHYHGGCVLQKVVDSSYRVRGVRSLRVVDGSTFTSSPGSNPQATVMMLGR